MDANKNGFCMSDGLPWAEKSAPAYHPSVAAIMRWFEASHLGDGAKAISGACGALAKYLATRLPANPETTAGLRKLLEAKDCFVRAFLAGQEGGGVAPPKEVVSIYLHADKDANVALAREIGLNHDAECKVAYACSQVAARIEITRRTGETRIVAVDGRLVL